MRRKTKTYKKIAKVFDELGIRLVKEDTLYTFEKEHVDYLIGCPVCRTKNALD